MQARDLWTVQLRRVLSRAWTPGYESDFWTDNRLVIPDSGDGVTIGTIQWKAPLLTENHVEEWKKAWKNDFQGIRNEIEDLKSTVEDIKGMKNEIKEDLKKKMADVKSEMKKDFERQTKEIKTHFQEMKKQIGADMKRSNEEVLKRVNERDQHLKTIAFFKAESERLKMIKSSLPEKTFNEERYKLSVIISSPV